jgi:hypothetical protein
MVYRAAAAVVERDIVSVTRAAKNWQGSRRGVEQARGSRPRKGDNGE